MIFGFFPVEISKTNSMINYTNLSCGEKCAEFWLFVITVVKLFLQTFEKRRIERRLKVMYDATNNGWLKTRRRKYKENDKDYVDYTNQLVS